MQNKGLIRVFAILFGLVCLYQLSFTFITNNVETDAEDFAVQEIGENEENYSALRDQAEARYLDSIGNNEVIAGITYNNAKDKELNKGLDLKGGINVILQISVKDILSGLANDTRDPAFRKAIAEAEAAQTDSQENFVDLFFEAFNNIPDAKLASPDIFANKTLSDEVNFNMSNAEVEPIIKINLRGKNRDFITKIGKELSIILPTDPNTSSGNEKLNILWLSPDEWILYTNDKVGSENYNYKFEESNIQLVRFERSVDQYGWMSLMEWYRPDLCTGNRCTIGLDTIITGPLDDIFNYIISGDETKRNKPFPEPYLAMMKKLNVLPENSLIIEDSLNGLHSALASGAHVIAITGSVHYKDLLIAHRIITHLDEITLNFIGFSRLLVKKCSKIANYLPIQKSLKILPNISSTSTFPTIMPK